MRLTPRHYAYARISEGCNQKCTFCMIPAIRGPLHSKPPDELLEFVRDFGFDAVGAFQLSLEPETPSADLKVQLDEAVKQERYERLMLTQQEVAFAAARRRIDTSFEVVVGGPAERQSTGTPG